MEVILTVIVDFSETLFYALFGDWGNAMATLLIFMTVDFVSSEVIEKLYKTNKTSKMVECKTGWIGISKKCMLLIFIMVAHRMDLLISTKYIKQIVVIAFITNELLSLIENAKMMGIRVPKIFMSIIELLREKIGMAAK